MIMAGDGSVSSQKQEYGRNKQLVGNRIQHAADRRRLFPDACQIAVKEIGNAGDQEYRQRSPAGCVAGLQPALEEEAKDHERNRDNTSIGEDIRQ